MYYIVILNIILYCFVNVNIAFKNFYCYIYKHCIYYYVIKLVNIKLKHKQYIRQLLEEMDVKKIISKELIEQARKADLASYLLSVGVPLIKDGYRYKHKLHNSLVFTKNAYYWNSKQEHGNSIDYLMKHMNMNFKSAIIELNCFNSTYIDKELQQSVKIEISQDYKKIIAYLNKNRNISYDIIRNLIKSKYIYQEQKTNNIIFPIYDKQEKLVGAELEGTLSDKRFKGIKANSRYGYGFNIKYGNRFIYALFFESAVDLISFIDLKTNYENKSLQNCILVSMAGLKLNILKHTLNMYNNTLKCFLCVDNDNAGLEFIKNVQIQKIEHKIFQPRKEFKDWNEQLKYVVLSKIK